MTTGKEQFEREFEAFLAGEESRVAALYRKLPQPEPDARLDAAVRAMAHRALNPQLVATPRAPASRSRAARWLPAFGAAAGIVLAAGIAYRLGVPEGKHNDYSRRANEVIEVRPIDAPAPAAEPPLSPPPAAATAGAPAPKAKPQPGLDGRIEAAAKPAPAAAQQPGAFAGAAATRAGDEAARGEEKTAVAPQAFPEQDRAAMHDAGEAEVVESGQRPGGAGQNLRGREQPEHRKKEEAQLQDRLGFGEHLSKQRAARRDKDATAAPPAAATLASPSPPAAAPPAAAARSTAAAANTAPRSTAAPQVSPDTVETSGAPATTRASDSKDAALRAAAPAQQTAAPSPPQREDAQRALAPPEANEPLQRARTPAAAGAAAAAQPRADSGTAHDALEQKTPASSDPNARLYPEHWLENIRAMLRENRRDDALRSLAEFRRLYPDYDLPEDLRGLK